MSGTEDAGDIKSMLSEVLENQKYLTKLVEEMYERMEGHGKSRKAAVEEFDAMAKNLSSLMPEPVREIFNTTLQQIRGDGGRQA